MLAKKIFITLLLSFFVAVPAHAGTGFQQEQATQFGAFAGTKGANLGEAQDPRQVVGRLIQQALLLVGVLFLAYTVYAGFMILTSGGDEQKIDKGKKTLRYAVIGAIVTLSGYSMLIFINRALQDATRERDALDFEHRSDTEEFNHCLTGGGDPISCGR